MAAPVKQTPISTGIGIVKQILSGDCLVIRGQPKGGPPPERTLALSNVVAPRLAKRPTQSTQESNRDEPFAWQSREYLRRLLIGKEVKFAVEYKVPVSGREYGTVWTKVNGEEKSVNELVVSEGWADVRQGGRASE
jgi:staphylococcal nuclease domain-containing protein 1